MLNIKVANDSTIFVHNYKGQVSSTSRAYLLDVVRNIRKQHGLVKEHQGTSFFFSTAGDIHETSFIAY